MSWKGCLADDEKAFRQREIQPRYNGQKGNSSGWGDNGEVMAFFCFRLWNEVQRLRTLAREGDIALGPEEDWFEIPEVGPGTSRPGTPAGKARR